MLGCTGDDGAAPPSSPDSSTVPSTSAIVPEAVATPPVVRARQVIRVTPNGETPRHCQDTATLSRVTDGRATELGYIGPGPLWQPLGAGAAPTIKGCAPPPSAAPADYVVPDIPPGDYMICLWDSPAACAAFVLE